MTSDHPPVEAFSEENQVFVRALRGARSSEIWEPVLHEIATALDDELAEEILRLITSDRPVELRSAAAIALGPGLEECFYDLDEDGLYDGIGDPTFAPPLSQAALDRVRQTLRRVYLDGSVDALVRRYALEAAVRCPSPWQEQAVRAAWASDDVDWRRTAVFCMGFLYQSDFDEAVVAGCRDEEPSIRREAMLAAGRRELTDIGPDALALAADRLADEDLRIAAILALPGVAPDDARPLLESCLEEEDEWVREAAEEALEELQLHDLADIDPDGALGDDWDDELKDEW